MWARRAIVAQMLLSLICLFPVGYAPSRSAQTPPDFKLVRLWGIPLDTPIVAICPNGTIYLVSLGGEVSALDSDGKLHGTNLSIGPMKQWVIAACDRQNHLYLAAKELSEFEPDVEGKLSKSSSVHLKTKLSAFVVSSDGSIHALTFDGSLISISRDGTVARLTTVSHSSPLGNPIAVHDSAAFEGTVIWDNDRNMIVYALSGDPDIHVFDPSANGSRDTRMASLYRSGRIARLPNGGFAVLSLATSEIADVFDRNSIQLLDSSFKPVGSIPIKDVRALTGSSSNGSLYFARTNTKGRELVKESLIPDTPASE